MCTGKIPISLGCPKYKIILGSESFIRWLQVQIQDLSKGGPQVLKLKVEDVASEVV